MNFGSLGSFEFLWQCLSSLEIFDRNAKASWSNFKVDRNPEFRSLKQGYKKRNISSRGSLNWHYPSILYLLWMRRKCHSLRRDLSENWDFFIKFNMLWTYYKSPTKKQKEYERLFTFGMILLSFRFFGKNLNISKVVAFAHFGLLPFNLDHSTYTWDQTLCITWGIAETLHCIWGSLRQFC